MDGLRGARQNVAQGQIFSVRVGGGPFFMIESGEVGIFATNHQDAAQKESNTANLCLFRMIWRSLFCDIPVSMELFSLD